MLIKQVDQRPTSQIDRGFFGGGGDKRFCFCKVKTDIIQPYTHVYFYQHKLPLIYDPSFPRLFSIVHLPVRYLEGK